MKSEIVNSVWHAVAKAAPHHLKADVAIVFEVLKKKTRAYGGTAINYYKSLLHFSHSFPKLKLKKPSNLSSSSSRATSSYERQVVPYDACTPCNNNDDDDSINPVSTFILKRINEDAPILEEEIDRLADDFISCFHATFRLEKQRSYRQYEEMLARST